MIEAVDELDQLSLQTVFQRLNKVESQNRDAKDILGKEFEHIYLDPDSDHRSSFVNFDINVLVAYLEACHADYRNILIPNIVTSFNQLLKNISGNKVIEKMGPFLIYGFKEDALAHFAYEELHLFPYALLLERGVRNENYSTDEFEENHPEHIVDVDRLTLFLKMFEDELSSFMTYRILMKRLHLLKREFDLHGMIEDEVLIPKLKTLEQR